MNILAGALGAVMKWCYGLVRNYGLAIVLFTFFSKVVLLPVTIWVQRNSIKMVRMMPELNRIKIRHFGDKDTIADETSKLYKKNKYSALASIVPLVLQITLLLGVISVIYHPLDYVLGVDKTVSKELTDVTLTQVEGLNPESNSLQLAVVEYVQNDPSSAALQEVVQRHSETDVNAVIQEIDAMKMNFLGFDLGRTASKDGGISILAPFLAGLSAWLLSFCQNRMNVLQSAQGKMSQFGTMAFSVGISLYLGFFVPVGVAVYWVFSNLFTILQQYILNKVINPKKYVDYAALEETTKELAQYNANSKKNKRKRNDPLVKRAKADYKRFFSVGNKHLVFYSESNGFYKYYAGTIDFILKYTNIPLHYITSDPNDQIFEMAKENPQIIPYYIDDQSLITLMMKMDADVVVMTMPDLETYQIKRSYVRKDIEYVYIPHCMNSLNLTMRKGCTDHFDSVLCTGKHQLEEIRKTEEVYGLQPKILVEAGYPLLDDMIASYQESQAVEKVPETKTIEHTREVVSVTRHLRKAGRQNSSMRGIRSVARHMHGKMRELTNDWVCTTETSTVTTTETVEIPPVRTVLIAPSWQKDNIVDSCLDALLDALKGHDYKIIVRPHPQHVRHMPERMEQLKQRFADDDMVEIQTDFTSNSTVFEADMMITDWSGIAYEYAYTTLKPVLFINTPMKIMNPEYEKIGIEPFNIYMRDILGASIAPENVSTEAAEKVEYLLTHKDEYQDIIRKTVDEYCYHVGDSGEASARYIINAVMRQARGRVEEEKKEAEKKKRKGRKQKTAAA